MQAALFTICSTFTSQPLAMPCKNRFGLCLSFYCVLSIALLFACSPDSKGENYDINNTSWENVSEAISLEFGQGTVDVTYGPLADPLTYTAVLLPFSYSAQNFQGSVLVTGFTYTDGQLPTAQDVSWLFSVSQDTKTLSLSLFSRTKRTVRTTIQLSRI